MPNALIIQNTQRGPAAERAFQLGRSGQRPAHAMSRAELDAWTAGMRETAEGRDPFFGMPRLWWWVVGSLLLVVPLNTALAWMGLPAEAEFLRGGLGQGLAMLAGPEAAVLGYWLGLFALALAMMLVRPLEGLLVAGGGLWWVMLGMDAAFMAGLTTQRFPSFF